CLTYSFRSAAKCRKLAVETSGSNTHWKQATESRQGKVMRISTNMIYDMGSSKIADLQAAMLKTQQQISTNRRVLTPADDPIASASAIGINQAISMNEQFTTNRQNAKGALA